MYTDYERVYTNYLMHHGTKGMKWGVRRTLKKYNALYDRTMSNLNKKNPNYHNIKKMIKNDKANINKMTSKRDIKNKSFFNGVKYNSIATVGITGKKINVKKLNNIMEKDWAKNKVQIVKEMKTQRQLGKATVASALAIYGGLGVAAIGMVSRNNHMMNVGLAATIGGSIGASVGTSKLATSKLARRMDGYTTRNDIYYRQKH